MPRGMLDAIRPLQHNGLRWDSGDVNLPRGRFDAVKWDYTTRVKIARAVSTATPSTSPNTR